MALRAAFGGLAARGKTGLRLLSLLVAGLVVSACQKISDKDFVGKWQSSRAVTPIYMMANGEWEIRKDDGTILQYGVWRYSDKKLIWSIRLDGRIIDDANPVLSVERSTFQLKERDGATTVFRRLD
ncbi:MAG: hypothetical protein H6R14_2240 [Proteobacteria bacterium]|nr:hypothetical protein [Pseudomonadota bacterium]